jgi:hypothetical protein
MKMGMTIKNKYVEWNGEYMLCDKPLRLTTPPEMVLTAKE